MKGKPSLKRPAGCRGDDPGPQNGRHSLADLAKLIDRKHLDPQPRSGRQEHLAALLNRGI